MKHLLLDKAILNVASPPSLPFSPLFLPQGYSFLSLHIKPNRLSLPLPASLSPTYLIFFVLLFILFLRLHKIIIRFSS
jgi:hypothetical protein